ncbi:hypothetical protein PsYK624_151470 [Phanerochaete sordida]|uniref:Uncharacterized protein n=1 Tax=Phanerochaete sordida TaxID=48140 RepID=A0A9P3GSU6_9APHY|nr:hypothetical protein PsYK624_151470 [Phanerochaete sordida]
MGECKNSRLAGDPDADADAPRALRARLARAVTPADESSRTPAPSSAAPAPPLRVLYASANQHHARVRCTLSQLARRPPISRQSRSIALLASGARPAVHAAHHAHQAGDLSDSILPPLHISTNSRPAPAMQLKLTLAFALLFAGAAHALYPTYQSAEDAIPTDHGDARARRAY